MLRACDYNMNSGSATRHPRQTRTAAERSSRRAGREGRAPVRWRRPVILDPTRGQPGRRPGSYHDPAGPSADPGRVIGRSPAPSLEGAGAPGRGSPYPSHEVVTAARATSRVDEPRGRDGGRVACARSAQAGLTGPTRARRDREPVRRSGAEVRDPAHRTRSAGAAPGPWTGVLAPPSGAALRCLAARGIPPVVHAAFWAAAPRPPAACLALARRRRRCAVALRPQEL